MYRNNIWNSLRLLFIEATGDVVRETRIRGNAVNWGVASWLQTAAMLHFFHQRNRVLFKEQTI